MTLNKHDKVTMKPPTQQTTGMVVNEEPIVVGGARYWYVSWTYGSGEEKSSWSPESTIARVQ